MKVVDVELTPNPDALKFIVDGRLLESGARSFDTPAAAGGDPLAEAIFSSGAVRSVFYMDQFVTVTKSPGTDWKELQSPIAAAIESKAVPAPAAAPSKTAPGSHDDLMRRINEILDENIRPALAGDGGGLEVLDYSDYVLTVHYQGACGSCPSATAGTLMAIQNLLQRMVDPRIQVVPA
jgi:NFU1 iron-sulfur cluster scaffold homolog, mitochondrial